MYFEEQNLFSSLNQSNEEIQKMMNLSASNDEYILQSGNQGKQNFQSKSQQNLEYSSFGQPTNALIIDSQNQQMASSQSSSALRNAYSKYQSQIKSLLPQIHSHLIQKYQKQFELKCQERLENYRAQISQKYQLKIQNKIDQIKENINSNLSLNFQRIKDLKQKIGHLKRPQKDLKKTLTPQQQHQLIQRTVQEILVSQKLLNQIKEKLRPKVQQRVRFILIRDLQKELTTCQNQIQDKIAQQRQEFKQKRKIHWEQEAQNELKELAVQFQQLKEKKANMEEIVKQKINQRQNVMKKYKEAVENFKQSKELEKNIKELQERLTKGNNTKRTNSKSIEKKTNKKN